MSDVSNVHSLYSVVPTLNKVPQKDSWETQLKACGATNAYKTVLESRFRWLVSGQANLNESLDSSAPLTTVPTTPVCLARRIKTPGKTTWPADPTDRPTTQLYAWVED
jgi:hypothetical protein